MTLFAKTAAVLTLACSALSGTAFADTYHHIDQLAVTVERQARQLEFLAQIFYQVDEILRVFSNRRFFTHVVPALLPDEAGDFVFLISQFRQGRANFFHHLRVIRSYLAAGTWWSEIDE